MLLLVLGLLVGCSSPQLTAPRQSINVIVQAGEKEFEVDLPAGSTVQDLLEAAGQTLEGKDRVEPPASTVLEDDATVEVIRVEEVVETEEKTIPYQVIRQPTENLPEGEEQLLQAGENGLQEVAYLQVLENGVEVSYEQINQVTVREPVDEIVLVGRQASQAPVQVPGKLVYLSDGSAWMMEGTSSNRTLLVGTGDLDGRVFRLSGDGDWLLFTRQEEDEDVINSLWAANLSGEGEQLIDLEVENVIHFADWVPGTEQLVAYSTVETRVSAPGWQANNNLELKRFSINGWTEVSGTLVDTNYGGVYGWWGTDFTYAPGGDFLAYASPDQVGLIEVENKQERALLELVPYNTRGDWAWMPGVDISPDGDVLYTVRHDADPEAGPPEESPHFDLVAIPLSSGVTIPLQEDVGMFAYPLAGPSYKKPSGESAFQLAFLQAAIPEQSASSSYRVTLMDRDGSNRRQVFPPPDQRGLEPRRGWGAWGPEQDQASGSYPLAVLFENNIWILDTVTGEARQVTGDGRVQRLDW